MESENLQQEGSGSSSTINAATSQNAINQSGQPAHPHFQHHHHDHTHQASHQEVAFRIPSLDEGKDLADSEQDAEGFVDYSSPSTSQLEIATREARRREEEVDTLLCAMLPTSALVRLASNEPVSDWTNEASVLFSDMAVFTDWNASRKQRQVGIFPEFFLELVGKFLLLFSILLYPPDFPSSFPVLEESDSEN
jgi:hypothetical protein